MAPDALLWVAVVAVIAWRVESVLRVRTAWRRHLEERELALRERELALTERRSAVMDEVPELPLDLKLRCNSETELWAKEQMRSVVEQLWRKHGDWDRVRSEVSQMDAQAVMAELGWSQTEVVS